MSKNDEYDFKSHKFLLKQLEERFKFEIKINKELFNKQISLDELISYSHDTEVFSKEEYKKAYDNALKNE